MTNPQEEKGGPGVSNVLLIDNFDSFTYNLVQQLEEAGATVHTLRPGERAWDELLVLAPTHLVISPGPGTPQEADLSLKLLEYYIGRLPVLGVCLGHQCLAHYFGAPVGRAVRPVHGKTAQVRHDGEGYFRGLPNPFFAMRYHSLVVEEDEAWPKALEVSARASTGEIMGIRVRGVEPLAEGVQFHPESILTPEGGVIIRNFLAAEPAESLR